MVLAGAAGMVLAGVGEAAGTETVGAGAAITALFTMAVAEDYIVTEEIDMQLVDVIILPLVQDAVV